MEHNPMIVTQGLTRTFHSMTAVADVTFSVAEGEIF